MHLKQSYNCKVEPSKAKESKNSPTNGEIVRPQALMSPLVAKPQRWSLWLAVRSRGDWRGVLNRDGGWMRMRKKQNKRILYEWSHGLGFSANKPNFPMDYGISGPKLLT